MTSCSVPAGESAESLTARMEKLAYQTSLSLDKGKGRVPVCVSIFPRTELHRAAAPMKKVFATSFCFSDLVAVASEGARIANVPVPHGSVGLATVSNILVRGVLLKAGIPAVPKFAGILEVKNRRPIRFVELIEYGGSSLDPSQIFIAGKMTSVNDAVKKGSGRIMANFWEIPAPARADVDEYIGKLRIWGVRGLAVLGMVSAPVCEMPVAVYRFGMVIAHGLNPVAAAAETGVETVIHTMSGLVDSAKLRSFESQCR